MEDTKIVGRITLENSESKDVVVEVSVVDGDSNEEISFKTGEADQDIYLVLKVEDLQRILADIAVSI